MSEGTDVIAACTAALLQPGRVAPGDRVLVAFSGGVDSVVLLHALRFALELRGVEVVAAHFDHRMRPGSGADARWAQALADRWQVPLELGAAVAAPRSETTARRARYEWLYGVRARVDARWILTAHHADDQAETVLFRVARGTGVAGLRGIPVRRGCLLRPLLRIWKGELEAYAKLHDLDYQVDPTNTDVGFARNLIRHQVIPELEGAAPGVRRALVRLSRLAAGEESAWRVLLQRLVDEVVVEHGPRRVVLHRSVLLDWPRGLQARVLRHFVRTMGGTLGEAGTRALTEFTKMGASGRSVSFSGGLLLARDFDRLVLIREEAVRDERPLEIPAPGRRAKGRQLRGAGEASIGGRRLVARWSTAGLAADDDEPSREDEVASFPLARLAFPLRLRPWRTGDRIRLPYGLKKLKKLLGEARIPASEREHVAVLADAGGRVVWVPGLARAADLEPVPGEEILQIGIGDGFAE